MQLTLRGRTRPKSRLVAAALFCGALLASCADGRLQIFELAGARGGSAGAGLVAEGAGGDEGGPGGSGTGGAVAGGAAVGGTGGGQASGPLLLDDFDDGDNAVEPDGWWYVNDDGTGPPAKMTFDAVPERGVSQIAVHLAAGPTTGYGSFLGLDLPGGIFDATGFVLLSFWSRMEPAGELSVRFQSSRAKQYALTINLDATWQEVRLPIADFRSVDGLPLDPTDVTHLQFWLADSRPAYDLLVDDVWLLRDP
jgi:hypothetical protein